MLRCKMRPVALAKRVPDPDSGGTRTTQRGHNAAGLGETSVRAGVVMNVQTIGVIGAGQMGSGIAHVSALGGYQVLLHDVAEDRVLKALEGIKGNMARQVSRNTITDKQMADSFKLIEPIKSTDAFRD